MARDETPFPLAMQPRVTALAWSLANGNVILLDTHGPNKLARDETPYPLVRPCFIIFSGPSCFLLRSFLLLSRGSLGEASRARLLGARSGSGSGSAKRIFSKIAGSEAFSGAFFI
jgi:hypothetical protein